MPSSINPEAIKKLPACWGDVLRRPTSHPEVVSVLDGVRGFAALMVLADHSGLSLSLSIGVDGVVLFFILSGYLLTMPFLKKENALSTHYWGNYYRRRTLRILPGYIVYLFAALLELNTGGEWLFQHVFFQWGDGHLWSIKNEILFYLILPFCAAILYLLPWKAEKKALLLITLALLADIFFTARVFSIIAGVPHTPMRFIIAPFFVGMAACFFFYSTTGQKLKLSHTATRRGDILIALLAFGVTRCTDGKIYLHSNTGSVEHYSLILCLTYALVLLRLHLQPSGWLYALFNSIALRAIGIVGYSFYLWHVLVLNYLRMHGFQGGWALFSLAIFINYSVACVAYSYIERPFLKRGHSL